MKPGGLLVVIDLDSTSGFSQLKARTPKAMADKISKVVAHKSGSYCRAARRSSRARGVTHQSVASQGSRRKNSRRALRGLADSRTLLLM